MEKDKILILTGHYGDGHKQAAHAIQAAIGLSSFQMETVLIDPASLVHPTFELISRNVFIAGVKRVPSAYHYFYQKTRGDNFASTILKGFNRFGTGRVLKMLNTIRPSVVVSTCPISAGMVSALKEYGLIDVLTITVITDYSTHSYWIYPGTDRYLVGSEEVEHGLRQQGVDGERITVTGIPVDPKFSWKLNCKDLEQKYGMGRGRPTVLITGGGYGMIRKGHSILQTLEAVPFDLQLIVVCGHNRRLFHQLEQEAVLSRHHVHLTGYVDYIEELMAISDLMITKAGGLTVSEAIAMNLPMLLYPSIGGQEYDNTQFLLGAKTAWLAHDSTDLMRKASQMLTDRNVLSDLQNHAKQLQCKHAAFKVAQIITDTLPKPIDMNLALV
ncbi:MAG TPA: glycosyltransferase [Bacillales bacterium]